MKRGSVLRKRTIVNASLVSAFLSQLFQYDIFKAFWYYPQFLNLKNLIWIIPGNAG